MAAHRSAYMTQSGDTPMRQLVVALFALTGFSALCLQVVWQRVISIHGGVDLFSSATVVAAFMAGLGLGNLLGGALADRLGPHRSILAFAVANLGIGLFGWASIAIFYDGYRALAEHVQSLPAAGSSSTCQCRCTGTPGLTGINCSGQSTTWRKWRIVVIGKTWKVEAAAILRNVRAVGYYSCGDWHEIRL